MSGLMTSTAASSIPKRPQLLSIEDGPLYYLAIRFPKGFRVPRTEDCDAYTLSQEINGNPIFEKAYGRGLISHLAEEPLDGLPKISKEDESILLYKLNKSKLPEILTNAERYIAIMKVLQEFHSDTVPDYETLLARTDELIGQYGRIIATCFLLQ